MKRKRWRKRISNLLKAGVAGASVRVNCLPNSGLAKIFRRAKEIQSSLLMLALSTTSRWGKGSCDRAHLWVCAEVLKIKHRHIYCFTRCTSWSTDGGFPHALIFFLKNIVLLPADAENSLIFPDNSRLKYSCEYSYIMAYDTFLELY